MKNELQLLANSQIYIVNIVFEEKTLHTVVGRANLMTTGFSR